MHTISKWTGQLSLVAALSHIICCGLPLIASIASLGAVTGASVGLNAFHEAVHSYELALIIFSGSMLLLSGVSLWASTRVDCRSEGHCTHKPCAPKVRLSFKLYLLAGVLFSLNLMYYIFHASGHAH